jgi:N-acetylglutamate synthase-like GNAT family acetyltransferase
VVATRLVAAPAHRTDVPGIIALIGAVFAEYDFVFDATAEVPDLLDFPRHYEPPGGAFFVIRQAGGVVGSVGVERLEGTVAELHRLYLAPRLRGQGHGQALVEEILVWCRHQNITQLVLWSDTRFRDAHRLYVRMGFAQSGERVLPNDVNQTREYRFERPV